MTGREARRWPPELVLIALGALGAATVLLAGVLLGGLQLAAIGQVTDDPYPVRFGLVIACAAALGLAVRYAAPALLRRQAPATPARPRPT